MGGLGRLGVGRGAFLAQPSVKEADRELAIELMEQVSEAVRQRAYEKEQNRRATGYTVEQFGEMWTSGKLYELHGEVRGLKPKKSAASDVSRLKAHVYPYIGHMAVADVTEQDIERAMASAAKAAEERLKRPWRQGAKFQVYQCMRRLFDLAIKPGWIRTDNPVSKDLRPTKDKPKLFGFLYPQEFLALLGCTAIPVSRRVEYVMAVYSGLRKASLKALPVGSVDYRHGTLTSLESKTGLPQIFEISPDLVELLKKRRDYRGCPPSDAPLLPDFGG